jgi:hypothetical protein
MASVTDVGVNTSVSLERTISSSHDLVLRVCLTL